MARPRSDSNKKISISLRVTPELHATIKDYMSRKRISLTQAVEELVSIGVLYEYYASSSTGEE